MLIYHQVCSFPCHCHNYLCVFVVLGLQLGRWRVWEVGSRQQRHPKIPQNYSRAAVQQSKSGRVSVTDGEFAHLILRCLSLFSPPGCGLCVCWLQTQRCCDKRWRALHVGRRRLWPTRYISGISRTTSLYDLGDRRIHRSFLFLRQDTVTARVATCPHWWKTSAAWDKWPAAARTPSP